MQSVTGNLEAAPDPDAGSLHRQRHALAFRESGSSRPGRVALAIILVGLLVTAACAWTAWTLDRHNEHRLLELQTQQAGDVVASTIVSIENPLVTAAQIATVSDGNVQRFTGYMAAFTGPGRQFASVSLWRSTGGSVQPVAAIGAAPALPSNSGAASEFIARAFQSPTVVVRGIGTGRLDRIGYAVSDARDGTFAVYGERSIPANRRAPIESNSAFSDLNFATYLGTRTDLAHLATTNLPLGDLPVGGSPARDLIPFGGTTLTLVAAPQTELGGALGAELPWIFIVGGVLLTIASAIVGVQLARRQRKAQQDARTIAGLYDQMDVLYGEQRSVAETLQHALLPKLNPVLANLDVVSHYIAGADRVDVGGDWYSVMRVDDRHFAFVVGDVSGRGISAATLMARLRFTIGAYLQEGHAPETVLAMCAQQTDVTVDGHLATVLLGLGDVHTREISLANAGHLNPLVISDGRAEFVRTKVGLPLGVTASTYESVTVVMPAGSTFLAFTDGLVERRGELLDVGLHRLASAAASQDVDLGRFIPSLITALDCSESEDDIAILVFRWRDQGRPTEHEEPSDAIDASYTTA